MAVIDNENWRELIDEYKNCPELWKIKSNVYKNKDLKYKSWMKLLKIYDKIESGASISTLKNKINNLRTCYRRELKKVIRSERSGAGLEDIYEPSLWYFNLLEFLRDHEVQLEGTSSIDSSDEVQSEMLYQQNAKKPRNTNRSRDEFLQQAVETLTNLNSEKGDVNDGDIYARSWALSFNKLCEEQKLYAKKAIDDILLLGQLNKLTLNVVPSISSISPGSSTSSTYNLSRSSTPLDCNQRFSFISGVPVSRGSANTTECGYITLQDLMSDTQFS